MGALNFSRLDSATLEVRGLFKDVPAATRNAFSTNMIILAESYNILRFQGGMGGLAYQSGVWKTSFSEPIYILIVSPFYALYQPIQDTCSLKYSHAYKLRLVLHNQDHSHLIF